MKIIRYLRRPKHPSWALINNSYGPALNYEIVITENTLEFKNERLRYMFTELFNFDL